MVKQSLFLPVVVGLGLVACTLLQSTVNGGQDDDRIAELIKQLGSDKFALREKAQHDLEGIGMPALGQLREAAKHSDLEIARRSRELLKTIEDKVAVEMLLVAKKVKFSLKDTSGDVAMWELQKQSDYQIRVVGDSVQLSRPIINLETGELPFWEAFDKLCKAGEMRERRSETAADDRVLRLRQLVQIQRFQLMPPPNTALEKQMQMQMQAFARIARDVSVWAENLPKLPGNQPNVIVVRDGVPEKLATSYYGALRLRLLPAGKTQSADPQPGQENPALQRTASFILEVCPEPRLHQFSVVGRPQVDKAIDNQGRPVAVTVLAGQQVEDEDALVAEFLAAFVTVGGPDIRSSRQARLEFKLADKQAKDLKEVSGSVTVRALGPTPDILITVPNVLNSAGKTYQGPGDSSIQVLKIDAGLKGLFLVHLRVQHPHTTFPAIGTVLQRKIAEALSAKEVGNLNSTNTFGLPVLVDANGKALKVTQQAFPKSTNVANGQLSEEVMITYRAGDGVGEPTQMVLLGHRLVTAKVPFRFENVPVP